MNSVLQSHLSTEIVYNTQVLNLTKIPVIILHGWAIDQLGHEKWAPLLTALAAAGIEAKLLDIPGLSAPLNEVWGLNNYVKWLDIQLKKYEKVILIGHSFGGQLAVRYAAIHPQKLQKLILIDSSGLRSHALPAVAKRKAFLFGAKFGKTFLRGNFFRKVLYKLAREHDYENASPFLRQTMAKVVADEVRHDLTKVAAPTLIIWGEEDKVTPLAFGIFFQKFLRNSTLKIVMGARHSPQFTHTAIVAQYITEFVQ